MSSLLPGLASRQVKPGCGVGENINLVLSERPEAVKMGRLYRSTGAHFTKNKCKVFERSASEILFS